jgi:hypothetical protein
MKRATGAVENGFDDIHQHVEIDGALASQSATEAIFVIIGVSDDV